MKRTFKNALSGIVIGVVNGMLGAGGGMVAVPLLKKSGMEQKQAHANAVAVILPVSVISAVIYLINGNVKISHALPFIPAGVVGSVVATLLLKKISPKYLKIIFGGFMVWAGIRMLMR
ncbi:MAG: sulfite exporter TauE/SafE family protein [Acutalibacteraceae bacterium]|nr:sulfite exporter TauE/SafE family protein [Acutalibacteraceae bacterium]